MDSRERTFLALDFQEPDRVPVDFWMSSGFQRKLFAATGMQREEFLDAHDVDLRYIEGPAYTGPPLRSFPDGTEEDIWGVRRRLVTVEVSGGSEVYREVAESPLSAARSAQEVEDYDHWPSPDWFDYGEIKAQCERIRQQGRVVVFVGDRMNRVAQLKPAMYIRGVEKILMDLAMWPGIAGAVISRIRAFYCAYAERIFEAAGGKLDILLMGDDFGTQNGPFLSPGMWVDYLGDGFAAYARIARSHGVRVMHHTCGAVRPLIPLMIERGLEVLQSLQPEAAGMDPRELKAEFGDRLAFHGGVSIQRTMPHGTPAEVRSEVRDRVKVLAPGGGYILSTSHNVQADTPVENVEMLLNAYHDFGSYR